MIWPDFKPPGMPSARDLLGEIAVYALSQHWQMTLVMVDWLLTCKAVLPTGGVNQWNACHMHLVNARGLVQVPGAPGGPEEIACLTELNQAIPC